MTFNISTQKATSFIKEADGKQNPYSSQKAQTGDGVTQNELAMHLVDLQNGAGGEDRGAKGGLAQTILTGNEGKGYFDLIAQLDGVAGSISDQDMKKLSSFDCNSNNVTAEDFNQLKQDNEAKQTKKMTAGGILKSGFGAVMTGMGAIGNIPSNVSSIMNFAPKEESVKASNTGTAKTTDSEAPAATKELNQYLNQLNNVNDLLNKNMESSTKNAF